MTDRLLVVNADDFGLSTGTNAGIVRAHERGIVTSTSLMVHGRAAQEAAAYARAHPRLSVGLHVDLGEWVYEADEWVTRYERGPVEEEIPRQLERFRELVGRDPTHLDSHQHVHREGAPATILDHLADQLSVPLRARSRVAYNGAFYGQAGTGEPLPDGISAQALIELIEGLEPGATEIACHPGLDLDLDSPYRVERLREVEALCDPEVAATVERERVRLVPYSEIA